MFEKYPKISFRSSMIGKITSEIAKRIAMCGSGIETASSRRESGPNSMTAICRIILPIIVRITIGFLRSGTLKRECFSLRQFKTWRFCKNTIRHNA